MELGYKSESRGICSVDEVFSGMSDVLISLPTDICESFRGAVSLGCTGLLQVKSFRIPKMMKSSPSSKNSRIVSTENPRKRPRIPPMSDTKLDA